MAKEARYGGKYKYYRKKLPHPETGEYTYIYGRTQAERDAKVDAQLEAWAREAEAQDAPYVWQYAAQWFVTASASMSEDRKAAVRREINDNILPVIGQKKLAEVNSDDLKAVMAGRAKYAKATQEKTRQVLRRIFADAEEAGKIARDPARRLQTAGGRPTAKVDALTDAQAKTLLEAVQELPVRLFCLLGLYAGLRREEICALQWGCVSLDGAAPHLDVRRAARWVRNNQPEISPVLKSSAAWRTVPLPPALVDALRAEREALTDAQKADSARFVLTNREGGPWSYATLRSAWESVEARSTGPVRRRRKDPATGELVTVEDQKRLGDRVRNHSAVVTIDFPVTPHVLRHTYITRLILGGVDLKRVQYLAGHSSAKITLDIYTSLMGHRPEDLIADVTGIFAPDLPPDP